MVRGHEAAGNAPSRHGDGRDCVLQGRRDPITWPSEIGSKALLGAGSQRDRREIDVSGVFRPEPVADGELLVSALSRDYRPRSRSSRRALISWASASAPSALDASAVREALCSLGVNRNSPPPG